MARFFVLARRLAAVVVVAACVSNAAGQPDWDQSAAPVAGERFTTMHIELKTEGGVAHFPGLARPTVIDSDQLSDSDARELEKLVEGARFFARKGEEAVPPRGAADYRTYRITIETGGQRHTVRVSDLTADPSLKALVSFLRSKEREFRSKTRETPSR